MQSAATSKRRRAQRQPAGNGAAQLKVHLKVQTICVLQCIYCMPYASRGRILSDLGAILMDRLNLSISRAKTSIALGIHPATNHMYEAECHPILSFELYVQPSNRTPTAQNVLANHTRGQEPNI